MLVKQENNKINPRGGHNLLVNSEDEIKKFGKGIKIPLTKTSPNPMHERVGGLRIARLTEEERMEVVSS